MPKAATYTLGPATVASTEMGVIFIWVRETIVPVMVAI